jgi:hypothetical protein
MSTLANEDIRKAWTRTPRIPQPVLVPYTTRRRRALALRVHQRIAHSRRAIVRLVRLLSSLLLLLSSVPDVDVDPPIWELLGELFGPPEHLGSVGQDGGPL